MSATAPGSAESAGARPFRHRFDPHILREYDMRGIFGKSLNPADAYAVGRAFARRVADDGGARVAVGYDGRLSGPALEAELVRGLRDGGVHVLRIGRGPTPMLYFAAHERDVDGAIMVTGSHNPADYNGFKMVLAKKSFFGTDIKRLGEACAQGLSAPAHRGSVEDIDIRDAYVARLLRDIDFKKPLKMVWDSGNSAAGEILAKIVARLPGEHEILFPEIDGNFPNHHPDPTVARNLTDLIGRVRGTGADFGVAFDGDADRLGVVDGTGEILWGDQILALLARDILKTRPSCTVIADVKASDGLFKAVAEAGGNPLMWKTGHSLIKAKMAETGAPLAGEMSGHLFLADKWYGFDDALYAALRVSELVAGMPHSLAEERRLLPVSVSTPELRFEVDEDGKRVLLDKVRRGLAGSGLEVNDVDGVRVAEEGGWWLLRASNTQAVLVGRVEADTPERLAEIKEKLAARLRAAGLDPDWGNAA